MNKSATDNFHRSRILETGKKVMGQIENIVNSINLKYPELAGNIELPDDLYGSEGKENYDRYLQNIAQIMWKNKLMA